MTYPVASSARPDVGFPQPPPAVPQDTEGWSPVAPALPPTLALLGAGRAGTSVAAAFSAAGVRAAAVVARSEVSRTRAARLAPAEVLDPAAALGTARLVVLGVPDDALAPLVRDLARAGRWRADHVVVHLSGAQGLAPLAPASAAGATVIALHPATTFSGTVEDVDRLRAAVVGVTCAPVDEPLARALVAALGAEPVLVAEQDRPLWHAALAHASNHLVTVVADATAALAAAGVPGPARAVGPLARAALQRALHEGVDGLTGPVVRGDAETVAGHLAALGRGRPGAVAPYRALARRTADLAEASGRLSTADADRIRAALDEGRPPVPGPSAPPGPPVLLRSTTDLAAARAGWAAHGRRVVLVPTMGALHEGHRALVRAARTEAPDDVVLVSVFVNPRQFGGAADLAAYPSTLAADVAAAGAEGADAVWAPDVAGVYGDPPSPFTVSAGPLGEVLEGAARPGHLDGVATVVLTLWQRTGAAVSWFGEKDAQQLAVVRLLAAALAPDVEVRSLPTVRDADGLALSSRNVHLSPPERARGLALSRALRAGVAAAAGGRDAVLAAAGAELAEAGLHPDYLSLADDRFDESVAVGPARLLVAARVGGTRLIDNEPLTLPDTSHQEAT